MASSCSSSASSSSFHVEEFRITKFPCDAQKLPIAGVRVVFNQTLSELQIVIKRGTEKIPVSSDQIKGLPAFPIQKSFIEKCVLRLVGNRHLCILHSSQPRSLEFGDSEAVQALFELKLPIVVSNTITRKVDLPEISNLFTVQDLILDSAIWVKIITSLEDNSLVLHAYRDFLETLQISVLQTSYYYMDISAVYGEMLQAFSEQNVEKACSKLSEAIAKAQQEAQPLAKSQACLDRFSLVLQEQSLNLAANSLPDQSVGIKMIGFDFLANLVQVSNSFISQSMRNQSLLIESMKLCFSELVISHPQCPSPLANLRRFWPCWSVLVVFWKMVDNLFSGSIRDALSDLKHPPFEKHVAIGKGIFYARGLARNSKLSSMSNLNARAANFIGNMQVDLDLLDSKEPYDAFFRDQFGRRMVWRAHRCEFCSDPDERIGAQWTRSSMEPLITEKEGLQEECVLLKSRIAYRCQDCLEMMRECALPSIESTETARQSVKLFFGQLSDSESIEDLYCSMEKQSALLRKKSREYESSQLDILGILDQVNRMRSEINLDRFRVEEIVTLKFPEVSERYREALPDNWSFAVVTDRFMDNYAGAKRGTHIRDFLVGFDSKGEPPQWTLESSKWEKQIEEEIAKIDELRLRFSRSSIEAERIGNVFMDAQIELQQKFYDY